MHQPLDQSKRPLAKGELGTAGGAEEIRDEPERRALDVGEQQRRATGRDHAAVDLGGLERRIDRRIHRDDRVVTAEESMNARRSGNS